LRVEMSLRSRPAWMWMAARGLRRRLRRRLRRLLYRRLPSMWLGRVFRRRMAGGGSGPSAGIVAAGMDAADAMDVANGVGETGVGGMRGLRGFLVGLRLRGICMGWIARSQSLCMGRMWPRSRRRLNRLFCLGSRCRSIARAGRSRCRLRLRLRRLRRRWFCRTTTSRFPGVGMAGPCCRVSRFRDIGVVRRRRGRMRVLAGGIVGRVSLRGRRLRGVRLR
jgi:hypothetical protein